MSSKHDGNLPGYTQPRDGSVSVMESNKVRDTSMFLNDENESNTHFHSQLLDKKSSLLRGSASGKTVGFIDHGSMMNKLKGELNMKKKRPKLV